MSEMEERISDVDGVFQNEEMPSTGREREETSATSGKERMMHWES